MKKTFYSILLFILPYCTLLAQLNLSFVSRVEYGVRLNDVWGYANSSGEEYALVGLRNGVSIIDLTVPENPIERAFIPGETSTWRDIKTWGDFAYVVADQNNTREGILVIDLSELPDTVTYQRHYPLVDGDSLFTCHNLFIDEYGIAYLSGCATYKNQRVMLREGGVLMFDLTPDVEEPLFVGAANPVYSHDAYAFDNILYSAEISDGQFGVYDVEHKANPVLLATQNTPFAFTHNTWLDSERMVLYTTDERSNASVAAYDVSEPNDIRLLDEFRPFATIGTDVIPHNVHVWEDWLIVSYYSDGCILVDISDPENIIEVGNFDTFIPDNTGFNGAWGAYPYLPSGLVLVSDITSGLYILKPNYVYAARLEGKVTDLHSGLPINNASVEILNTQIFTSSNISGNYKTGIATGGTYSISFDEPTYQQKTIEANLTNGETLIRDVALTPLVPFEYFITVLQSDNVTPIPNTSIRVRNAFFEFHLETDVNGKSSVPVFYEGTYEITAGKWGFQTILSEDEKINASKANNTIILGKSWEDPFELDLGWGIDKMLPDGAWELGLPDGVQFFAVQGSVTPKVDANDIGKQCYLTQIGPTLLDDNVNEGITRLTSPVFDLSNFNDPRISFSTWFYNYNLIFVLPADDALVIHLNNGITSVVIDSLKYGDPAVAIDWEAYEINVTEHLEPTANMTISFETYDFGVDVTEAGIDHFRVWDADPVKIDLDKNGISMVVFPNPYTHEFMLDYIIPFNLQADLVVYNALGQKVLQYTLINDFGRFPLGKDWAAGVYFVQILGNKKIHRTIRVVKG